MKPIEHFDVVWSRCSHLTDLHAYISTNVTAIISPDEILRAEWVARVSALDLYVHELVAQNMLEIFEGRLSATPAYLKFKIMNDTLNRIKTASNSSAASSAFDLDIRNQLCYLTFQDPEKIAEGVRLFSQIELWNEVALKFGATATNQSIIAKGIKKDLSLIVERRNKIAHEGDLQPVQPRQVWPISVDDLVVVRSLIERIVRAIDDIAS